MKYLTLLLCFFIVSCFSSVQAIRTAGKVYELNDYANLTTPFHPDWDWKHRIFQSKKDKECEFWWGEDSDYSWTEDGCWTYHDEESCIEEGGKMMSATFKNSTCLMPLEMIDENVDSRSKDSQTEMKMD